MVSDFAKKVGGADRHQPFLEDGELRRHGGRGTSGNPVSEGRPTTMAFFRDGRAAIYNVPRSNGAAVPVRGARGPRCPDALLRESQRPRRRPRTLLPRSATPHRCLVSERTGR